jgi:exodeoxyribonuclease V alpha subunit
MAELGELSLAYAASIHKSQGSEYPVVVTPLALQHYLLLERNLLYTAVTRVKKLMLVIAEAKALRIAVRNRKAARRITQLAKLLAAEQNQSKPSPA